MPWALAGIKRKIPMLPLQRGPAKHDNRWASSRRWCMASSQEPCLECLCKESHTNATSVSINAASCISAAFDAQATAEAGTAAAAASAVVSASSITTAILQELNEVG